MAKRRRRRRQDSKQKISVAPPAPDITTENGDPTSYLSQSKAVNFAREYFYVYSELRNVLVITVFMALVLMGLSYVI